MPRGKRSGFSFAGQLSKMVNTLKEQRAVHAEALRQVDAIFEKIGITTHLAEPAATPRRGRPPGRKPGKPAGKRGPGRPPKSESGATIAVKKGRRVRRKFATSGNDSILAFVTKAGKKGATTSEIVKQWKSEGRSGDGYTALGLLVKAKKLKRENIKGEKGSRYTVGG